MGSRIPNPATIPGKTRGAKVAAPILRKYTPEEIAGNNEKFQSQRFKDGDVDWKDATHPCNTYGVSKPDATKKESK